MTAPFDVAPLLAPDTPPPAIKWNGFPKYNFIGGNIAAQQVPVDDLVAAATAVLRREGAMLSTYNHTGPLGYRPLREFLTRKLKSHADIDCAADEILITSGSTQGLALVNSLLLTKGDTILVEQETYGSVISRLMRLGVNAIAIPLDDEGMRVDVLKQRLEELKQKGVKAKYIYTIPTIQNPTGGILGDARRAEMLRLAREHGVLIFEDECYSDLVWANKRPRSLYAMAKGEGVIFIGSFSKSLGPALRVGYIVAKWDVLSRLQALKQDAGTGAIEQMVLAEYCSKHFADHVVRSNKLLSEKMQILREALAEQFGTSAEFGNPPGGIFLWVKLPDNVDTQKLAQAALAAGVSINPGPEWSINPAHSRCRMRLCFANPEPDAIKQGVAVLAEVCHREFGVPLRSANVEKS
jgi:2-aminoadipate transaminase